MRKSAANLALSLIVAFVAGFIVSSMGHHAISDAHAEASSLTPMMIDLTSIKHADLPNTPYPELNGRGFVVTENATVGIQSGNIPKHAHPKTDEIQYIIEGSGSMWLGNERHEFKPGTLIIIPKGTAHAGTIVTSGPVKALVIKIPPQGKDDTVFLD